MSQVEFSGTSASGDIAEALQLAIQAAKEGIPSSMVNWKIVDISGTSGGFVEVNEVVVKILAEPPH
jgi:hypothetical protein